MECNRIMKFVWIEAYQNDQTRLYIQQNKHKAIRSIVIVVVQQRYRIDIIEDSPKRTKQNHTQLNNSNTQQIRGL